LENVFIRRCFKIFGELIWEVTTSCEETHFEDSLWIETENRPPLAAILGYEGRENGAAIFRPRSISRPFQKSTTIKYY